MLRNSKFMQGFIDPPLNPPVYEIDAKEVTTKSGVHTLHKIVRHRILPEVDNTLSAEDYGLQILLDSGVQLKPCPPYDSVSLDELSELNTHLDQEVITNSKTDEL